MKPTVKQEQIVKEQLENEDELIGELSPHEAELLKTKRRRRQSKTIKRSFRRLKPREISNI